MSNGLNQRNKNGNKAENKNSQEQNQNVKCECMVCTRDFECENYFIPACLCGQKICVQCFYSMEHEEKGLYKCVYCRQLNTIEKSERKIMKKKLKFFDEIDNFIEDVEKDFNTLISNFNNKMLKIFCDFEKTTGFEHEYILMSQCEIQDEKPEENDTDEDEPELEAEPEPEEEQQENYDDDGAGANPYVKYEYLANTVQDDEYLSHVFRFYENEIINMIDNDYYLYNMTFDEIYYYFKYLIETREFKPLFKANYGVEYMIDEDITAWIQDDTKRIQNKIKKIVNEHYNIYQNTEEYKKVIYDYNLIHIAKINNLEYTNIFDKFDTVENFNDFLNYLRNIKPKQLK